MILTILKNLFSSPVTRRYPFNDIREPVKGYRGKISFDESKCKLCGMCSRVCPAKAIEVHRHIHQITYHPFNCIYCGACKDGCPAHAIVQDARYTSPAAAKAVETFTMPAPEPAPVPVSAGVHPAA
jgi:ech hydrogenase subunit F